jgi:hypothetical protein
MQLDNRPAADSSIDTMAVTEDAKVSILLQRTCHTNTSYRLIVRERFVCR